MNNFFEKDWKELELKLQKRFGKIPSVESILFLIGLQETGFIDRKLSKEEKQDVMHIAVCTILSSGGYYVFEKKDKDNYPHFKELKPLPALNLNEQEQFLKQYILLYFKHQKFIN